MAKQFNWIQRIAELEKAGKPFAIATVIDTVAPTSAKPMAKAIIKVDGKFCLLYTSPSPRAETLSRMPSTA